MTPPIPMPQAQTLMDDIERWHGLLSDRGNAHYPQPLNREQVGYEPMHYFALLPRLQPPAGRVLDWLYVGQRNGSPFLYWRDTLAAAHTQPEQLFNEPGWMHNQDTQEAIAAPVQADGSAEGWLQLVLLRQCAGRTLLRWHAMYKSVTLVCSQGKLHQLVQRCCAKDPDLASMHPDAARAALALDVIPTVDLSDPLTARVGMTRFTQWGGFYRQTWAMNRHGPHALRLEQEVLQVPYNCGLVM